MFRERNKSCWGNKSFIGVPPSQQRFCAYNLFTFKINLRVVEQLELIILKRMTQAVLHVEPFNGSGIQIR